MAKVKGGSGGGGGPAAALQSVTALKVGFDQATAAMEKFVGAMSPSTVMQFEQSLKNLHATIGQALQPALSVLSDALQNAAAILDPIMQQLAPTIQKMGECVGKFISILAMGLDILLSIFQPIIDILLEFENIIADLGRILIVLIKTIMQVAAEAFKPFGDLFDGLIGAFKELIKAIVFTTAGLAKMLGANDFLGKMIANLEKIQNAGRVQNAAPDSVAIQDWASIAADAAKASVMAGGSTPAKTQEELLTDIIAGLKDIDSGRKDFSQVITESIEKWWSGAWEKIQVAWNRLLDRLNPRNW